MIAVVATLCDNRRVVAGASDEHVQQRRRWILAVLYICLLVVVIDKAILDVALPMMQRELHASQSREQWLIDAYTLVFAALLFTGGWPATAGAGAACSRQGGLRCRLPALGVRGEPAGAHRLAGLDGVSGAMVQPATLSIIQNTFKSRERGRAIGLWAGNHRPRGRDRPDRRRRTAHAVLVLLPGGRRRLRTRLHLEQAGLHSSGRSRPRHG